jgi:hypothetical protein
MADAALSVFSVVLVFIYVWVVTGSGFLAVVGMSEILLSLPIAWFILRVILQVKYFAGLNLLCIFIVCAVGEDDIFVFMDAYVQSQFKGPNINRYMETCFSWVYRKSGLAMLTHLQPPPRPSSTASGRHFRTGRRLASRPHSVFQTRKRKDFEACAARSCLQLALHAQRTAGLLHVARSAPGRDTRSGQGALARRHTDGPLWAALIKTTVMCEA